VTILVDQPPSTPVVSGPARGRIGVPYLYSFVSTDPDGDTLMYLVDWGDGNMSDWLGPFESGALASASHQWSTQGTYTVRVMAKDTYGLDSDWGTLQVTMPMDQISKQSSSSVFNQERQSDSLVTRTNT